MNDNDRNMLPIGTLLKQGEYRVERYIASGGFGNTYEVVHTRLPKRFAVKEFFMRGINQREGVEVSVSLAENRESFNQMREKFYKEAERLAVLEESHIVEVTDFFEENQTAYYVMKLIDGESLAATMKRTGKPFSEPEVRNVLSQVLPALETVHNQGIYHLDLKPGNIMRDAKGHCWLIDFGASKQLSAKESKTLSTSTGLSYTPGYAPGEQLSGNMNRIGAWTDFYALGATIYNLLSCQTPPEPDDVRYDGERAFHFPASVSDDMRQLVLWLMQPDYPRRPQKVSEITARLAEMSHSMNVNEEETDEQPKVAVSPEASIPTVKHVSQEIVQSSIEETVRTDQVDSEEDDQDEDEWDDETSNKKRWLWIAAGAALVVALGVWLLTGKSGSNKVAEAVEEDYIDQSLHLWRNADGEYGFIDDTGKLVIPCQWDYATDFSEGLARVTDSGWNHGYIDKTGEVVIPCEWSDAGRFNEGLAPVQDSNGYWGFIDKTGEIMIPCDWKLASNFSEGLAAVQEVNDRWGFIDKTGNPVISCKWLMASDFSEGMARVQDSNGQYGFIDKNGLGVIPCQWYDAFWFSEGLAPVQNRNGKWGFIENTRNLAIPCQWDEVGDFSEGLAPVKDNNGKWGYIDKTGQVVIPCQWRYAYSFSDGLALVRDQDRMYGYIDKTGEIVIPCEWEKADAFHDGLAQVEGSDDIEHYIDKTGRVVK